MIHARDHAYADYTGTFRQNGGNCSESLVWQGVPDDCDFVGRETGGEETIGGSLRVADYGIAPTKGGSLRAKLRGRHQVSELAMAADDDGHAGKPGGGNEREVGVEIEGVRDLHVMMAQIAAQVEARAQRLPSEETTAEAEFRSVWEVMGERAAPANATEVRLKLWKSKILREDGELALGTSRFKRMDHEKQTDWGRRIG
jgi:hypothetical protein